MTNPLAIPELFALPLITNILQECFHSCETATLFSFSLVIGYSEDSILMHIVWKKVYYYSLSSCYGFFFISLEHFSYWKKRQQNTLFQFQM